jgi:ESS family glutamate:Na+ symporter
MNLLGNLVGEGLKSTVFGFNFLIGTLLAIFVKTVHKSLRKYNYVKRDHINDFMMNRISGIAFDVMIVAGIAAIDLENIRAYWHVLAIMGIVGAAATYAYIYIVSKFLFKDYQYEQFFAMYGMLTGTASTGVILLREIDPNFETPAADNLVYQNLPAIVLGFPIMLVADYAPQSRQASFITLAIIVGLLAVLLVVLFRSKIFKRKAKN